jgi:hypothetical protein
MLIGYNDRKPFSLRRQTMSRITLDASVAKQLLNLQGPVEICDPTGKVLGRFLPKIDLSDWEPLSPGISDEELQRRINSNEKRYTTAEVLAYLEKLP